jgi:hypothetical protein
MPEFAVPTPEQVRDVVRLIPTPQLRRVFFSELINPHWVRALNVAHQFDSPPEPSRDEQGNVRELHWPEIDYLIRMAPLVPQDVVDVALKLQGSENSWVRRGVIEIASVVPTEVAARLKPLLLSWGPDHFGWRTDAGDLATIARRFLSNGPHKLGVQFANMLFRPRIPADGDGARSKPSISLDDYSYEQELPGVADALGDEALLHMLPWLEAYQEITGAVHDGLDYSWVRRPTIANHFGSHEVEDALIDSVRDAAVRAFKANPAATVTALDRNGYAVSRKILLFAAAEALRQLVADDADPEGIQAAIVPVLSSSDFADPHFRIEYAELVRRLPRSTPGLGERLVAFVEAGPYGSMAKLKERLRQDDESEADLEARSQRYAYNWRHRLLAAIGAANLPDALATELAAIELAEGVIEDPLQSDMVTSSWSGPSSPNEQAALSALDPKALVEQLATWHPDRDSWRGPSHEGQARELTALIAESPGAIYEQPDLDRRLRPTYLRSILRGWEDASKAGMLLEWDQVLDLTEAILRHSDASRFEREGDSFDDDPDFIGAKFAALALLEEIAKRRDGDPLRVGRFIVRISELVLIALEDPRLRSDYLDGGRGSDDPLTTSINRRWPIALRALVHLATWDELGGLGSAVLQALDQQLSLEDPFGAAAAVVGESLSSLSVWNRTWLDERTTALFGSEDGLTDSQQIALTTALATQFVHSTLLEILRPSLRRAIDLGDTIRIGWRGLRAPQQLIGEWIITVLIRGQIGFKDPLLIDFFAKSSPPARGEALGHIAWEFTRAEVVPDTIRDRFAELWDLRAEHVSESKEDAVELADFYWLVRGDTFPAEWWLPRFKAVVGLFPTIQTRGMVGEKLADAAAAYPREVIELLIALVERPTETAGMENYDLLERAVPEAVAFALEQDDAILAAKTAAFMDRLGESGYIELEKRVNVIRRRIRESGS